MKPEAAVVMPAQRLDGDSDSEVRDALAVEEPLEIRVAGERVTTTLRTPGRDGDLALGFLYAEGVIHGADDVGRVAHCGRPGEPGFRNVIDVAPGPGVSLDIERAQRTGLTTAACGVCGRQSIDDLLERCTPVEDDRRVRRALVTGAPELLSRHQPGFTATGGVHAAAAIVPGGEVVASAEDVGRHNAVDKVVGQLVRAGRLPRQGGGGAPVLLVVSGRAGFEIAQKAVAAGFAVLASVSAPSSLAVDVARDGGVTLAGFVRDGRATLYTHAERVVG